LPVGGQPVLQHIIEALVRHDVPDIVVVTGDKRPAVEQFLAHQYGARVRPIFNDHFSRDMNIVSAQVGVESLHRPEAGYLIVETDLVVAREGWQMILDVGADDQSFWVTRGRYAPGLTGGALRADLAGRVLELTYAPAYTPRHEGWNKLLGMLYVGPNEVAADRFLRGVSIEASPLQYYMMPWAEHRSQLPCRTRDLGQLYAASFNDSEGYRRIDRQFSELRHGREIIA
jgi:CTP:molybdopterin cytidylyltransferase MocA